MDETSIRCISIAVIENENKIFVFEGFDKIKKEKFYRPLGGGIIFGETSEQALKREFVEEINKKINVLESLSIIENIFEYEGRTGHEIVFIHKAEFVDKAVYKTESLYGLEDNGDKFVAKWIDIKDFNNHNKTLVPKGLLKILKAQL